MIDARNFKQEVMQWAQQVGVTIKEIHLRQMKRKWGSCSSKGRLTFNIEILNLSHNDRLEKVLHELLHLKYPNHGAMFRRMFGVYFQKLKNEFEENSENDPILPVLGILPGEPMSAEEIDNEL